MAGERTTCTVAEVAAPTRNAIVGGPFGSDLMSRDYVDAGVPVIRGANMGGGRWVEGDFAFVSPAKSASLAANHAEPGDIVFTQRGTLGQVALVPKGPHARYLISQSQMKLTVDRQKASPLFLYYVFRSDEQQEYIRKNAIQTGVPHTNLGLLKATPLVLPPLPEQKAIASILGAIDDKIELNRRMNETLEELARTIFKSWFVDFDPVKAKAEGRRPEGMDAETAKLFPSRFVESELGMIPEGWTVGRLDDLLVLQRGFDLPTQMRIPGPFPIVAASGPTEGHADFRVRGPGVVTGRSGVLGRVFLVHEDFWPLNTALWVKEFKRAGPHYAYFAMQRVDFSSYNAGSAVPTLNRNHVHGLPHALPPTRIVDAFETLSQPLFGKRKRNENESQTLAEIRDLLLPKLISGELRVPEAEKLAEAAL